MNNHNRQHNQNRHKKQHKDKPQKPMYNPNKEQLQEFNTGLGAELERGSRILGNTTSAVTDILPQTRIVKKISETIKDDKHGNKRGEWKTETMKSK